MGSNWFGKFGNYLSFKTGNKFFLNEVTVITASIKDEQMRAFRNFSVCVAIVSITAFSMTGCSRGGQGFSAPTQPFSSQQGFAQPQQFSGGSGSVNVPSGQNFNTPSFGGGSGTQNFAPSGSGSR